MVIKTVKLYRHSEFYTDSPTSYFGRTWDICRTLAREFFAIPAKTEVLYFTAYSIPGKHRVKIETDDRGRLTVDGYNIEWMSITELALKRLIKEHGPVYVGCEVE